MKNCLPIKIMAHDHTTIIERSKLENGLLGDNIIMGCFVWVANCSIFSIRGCPSRVRPFPEHLLVLLGVSNIWGKADRDPVLMRNGIDRFHDLLSF
ncbi:hypothetical protein Hanom_Chr14g01253521 [Helianthus anomalus]